MENANSLNSLNTQYIQCFDKIKALESDLKSPMEQDEDMNTLEEERRVVLNQLYRIEKENLLRIKKALNLEIEKR